MANSWKRHGNIDTLSLLITEPDCESSHRDILQTWCCQGPADMAKSQDMYLVESPRPLPHLQSDEHRCPEQRRHSTMA